MLTLTRHILPGLIGAAFLTAIGPSPAEAAAPADPMGGFYGNTVVISVPAVYYVARRHIDPDGTWTEPAAGGGGVKGVWKIENGQVCSWQTEPAIIDPHHYCYPVVAREVGETWVTQDPLTGNEVVQTIEKGRD